MLEGGTVDSDLQITQARLWQRMGRNPEALADAKQALPIARAAQGDQPHSYPTGQVWLTLAKLQHQEGHPAEARASVANALSNLEATLNGDHRLIREGRELVAELE